MKNTAKYILAIAAVAMSASCTKDRFVQEEESAYPKVEFNAIAVDAKTAVEDGHTVWAANDRIKVFFGNESATAKLKTGEGTSSATYEVRVPESTDYYAVYPADATSALVEADHISLTVPASQTGVFGAGHIAVAKAVEKTFAFQNVNAFLKFQVASAKYTRIVVESVSGAALAGDYGVKFGESLAYDEISNPSAAVEISSESPLAAGDYYVSVLPGVSHEKGIVVKYYRGENLQGTYFLEKAVTTEASKVLSFGAFEPSTDYFATVAGAGTKSGTSWDNAMDIAGLKKLIALNDTTTVETKIAALNGTTINLGNGVYDFGEILTVGFDKNPVEFCIVGGHAVEGVSDTTTNITGSDAHRLFIIQSGVKIKFENLGLVHGLATSSSNSAIVLESGCDVTFKDCRITDHQNWNGTKYSTCAGIVGATDIKIAFDGCEIANNQASWGASMSLKSNATFKDCNFHDNYGHNGPGNSIYIDNGDAVVTVDNCIFKDNTSSDTHGGAVGASGGILTFNGCTFENNYQTNKNGGAMRLWNSARATLNNCTMKGNHANYGGALYLENTAEIDIVGGLYEGNYAKGGGLMNASASSVFKISGNAVIKDNYCTSGHGGAILIDAGTLDCQNVTFQGNINKSSASGVFGGAIASTGNCSIKVDNCLFKENHNDYFGGSAINLQADAANMKLTNSTFDGNYVTATGISASNGNGNYGGGAIRLNTKGRVDVENCVFTRNNIELFQAYNHAYGGAVYINTSGTYTFNKCLFDGNFATRGGALCAWATGAKIYMNACSFTGNYISYRYGTTIHVEKAGEFCMNNCSIADNTYTTGGTSDWQACWVNLSTIEGGILLSNNSFLGSPRCGAEAAIASKNNAIIRFDTITGESNWFVNNIIVTEAAVSNNKSFGNYDKTINLVYTKRSDNSANGAGGSAVVYENPASNGFYASTDCFGGLQWMSGSSYAANYWKWNGTLAVGNNLTLCPAATAVEHIGKASGFKTWLEGIGALTKDQLGNERGTGDWWPGAYQGQSAQ